MLVEYAQREASKYSYTVVRPIFSCRAIALFGTPRATSSLILTCFYPLIGARPLYVPLALAALTPSLCRSRIMVRSNCATDASTPNSS